MMTELESSFAQTVHKNQILSLLRQLLNTKLKDNADDISKILSLFD